jgi:YHS domain-containing protein
MGILTRLLLIALLVVLIVRSLRRFAAGIAQGMGRDPRGPRRMDSEVKMCRDPVCGTYVVPGNALAVQDDQGLHYFCSNKCRQAFLAAPSRFGGR